MVCGNCNDKIIEIRNLQERAQRAEEIVRLLQQQKRDIELALHLETMRGNGLENLVRQHERDIDQLHGRIREMEYEFILKPNSWDPNSAR
jgi:hypothetical protein